MADSLNRLIELARQAGVAGRRHDLLAAAVDIARATAPAQASYLIAPFNYDLASSLLAGNAAARAAAYRAGFVTLSENDMLIPIGGQPESDWGISEWRMLLALRLLGRDFRPLPRFRGKPTYIAASSRADLRRWVALFEALSGRDAAATGKAIAALGRADNVNFSIMAYALYREARGLGIPVVIPRKYDF